MLDACQLLTAIVGPEAAVVAVEQVVQQGGDVTVGGHGC